MSRHLPIPLAAVGGQHDHRSDPLARHRDRRPKRRAAHCRNARDQVH